MFKFSSLPTQPIHLLGPLTLIALSIVLSFLNFNIESSLAYQSFAVEQGQIWRIITGHLLHTNEFHLLLNIVAVVLLWSLHGQYFTLLSYIIVLFVLALGTSFGLYISSPTMDTYVGLSGILHGLFILGAIEDIKAQEKTGYLLLLGVVVKLVHEQFYGASSDIEALIGANVAIDAHLYGALAAICIVIFQYVVVNDKTNHRV
ncbi:rhombosortase [Thalassotalea ganghwensis]